MKVGFFLVDSIRVGLFLACYLHDLLFNFYNTSVSMHLADRRIGLTKQLYCSGSTSLRPCLVLHSFTSNILDIF